MLIRADCELSSPKGAIRIRFNTHPQSGYRQSDLLVALKFQNWAKNSRLATLRSWASAIPNEIDRRPHDLSQDGETFSLFGNLMGAVLQLSKRGRPCDLEIPLVRRHRFLRTDPGLAREANESVGADLCFSGSR